MSWSHMVAFLAGIPVGVVVTFFFAALFVASDDDERTDAKN